MRDPKRIDRMLRKLEQTWKRYPDLRLGQLIMNVAGEDVRRLYYFEDGPFEKKLDGYPAQS